MSGLTPTPADGEPPPRPRRRRWLRRGLWALGTLVALLVALHTPPARHLVAGLLTEAAGAALGGAVRVGRLDYRLWAGQVSVEGLAVKMPRLEIECARAEVELGLRAGLRARVVAPRVVVTQGPEEVTKEPPPGAGQPWAPLGRFDRVDLEQGAVELRDREGAPWLRLEGVEVHGAAGEGAFGGKATVANAAAGWPGAGLRVQGLSAEAEFELEPGGALRVRRAALRSDEAELEGRGELSQIDPILARAEGGGRLDAGLGRKLMPELQLAGALDARVSFEKHSQGARGSLEVEVDELVAYDFGPWAGSVQATLVDRELRIDAASLDGYHGRAEASGTIPLGDGVAALEVHASGLDVGALVGTLIEEPPPLASRAEADLRLGIHDWDAGTLEGRGRVALAPGIGKGWPLAGPIDVRLADRRVSFSTDALRARTAEAAAQGSFTFARDLELRYSLRLPDLEGVPALASDVGVKLPDLALAGAMLVEGDLGGRLPGWEGAVEISSRDLSVEGVDVGVQARLALSRVGVQIESFAAEGVDGRMTASGFVPLAADGRWRLETEVEELRLTDALGLHGVPVPFTARGRVAVEGPRAEPEARFDLQGRAEAVPRSHSESPDGGDTESHPPPAALRERPSGSPGTDPPWPENDADDDGGADGKGVPPPVPAREPATLHLAGSASPRGVVLDVLKVALGGGTLEASGAWARDGEALEASARATDVQLARLPWLPGPAVFGEVLSTLSGELDLSGRRDAPEGRVAMALTGSRFKDQELADAVLTATLTGSEARLEGRLGGERLLTGSVAFLDRWPLHLDLDLAAVPLTEILRAALVREDGAEGTASLAGVASLDVPLRELDAFEWQLRVESLQLERGGGGSTAGPFTVQGSRHTATISGVDLRSGGSRLRIDGEIGLASDASSPLLIEGDVPLDELAALLRDASLAGEAEVDLQLAGRLADLDVSGDLRVEGGAGNVGPVPIAALELEARAERGVLTVGRARLGVAGGEVTATGAIPLDASTGGPRTLEVQVRGVDPGTLLPASANEPRLVAPMDLWARILFADLSPEAVEAEGEVTAWSVDAGGTRMSLEKPAAWRFSRRELVLDDLRLRGEQGHIGVDGSWRAEDGPRVRLTGEADLAFLNPFLGGELLLSGPGRVDLGIGGNLENLSLEGGASLEKARAVLREPPVVVSGLKGALQARGAGIEIEASGRVGDGTLRLAGTVEPSLAGPEVDVSLEADRVPLTFPEGLRSRSSGRVRLIGRNRRYRVEGDVTVHRAVFDRDMDFTSQSIETFGAELRALEERGSVLERVQLDVGVRLAEGLRIQNRKVQAVVDGAVTVGGDLLTPDIRGSVSVRDGGTVKLSRATLRLVDGRVDLAGFPSRPLEIDVSGRTQVTGIQIDVDLSGRLDDLRTSLSSPNRSDLTQADLATLLLTGRTAQAAADESGAIVAEEVAAALGSALNERFGGAILIDVSRDESLIVQDTDPTQRFNIGIPLGERLYVIHSQALDRSGVRWILDFRPQGQFRVRLINDSNDNGAVEVSHGFDFDLWSRGRRAGATAPERPRVREVRVEGLGEPLASEIARRAKLEPGDHYDFFEGDKASRRMEKELRQRGYLAVLVEAVEEPVEDAAVDVVFRVESGPRIDVRWEGDDPGGKLRKRFGAVWDSFLPLDETASRRARSLQNALRARGYYQAVVGAEVTVDDTTTRIVFNVRRGSRGRGVDLVFEGNASIPDASLAAVMPPTNTSDFFALIGPRGRSGLESALRTAGARAGFLSLQVGTPRESSDAQTGRLRVTIPVEEGELARVVSLDLPEEEMRLAQASPPAFGLAVGKPFRIDAYVHDRSALASWFRSEGFPEARVAGILEPVPEGLAVSFEVDAGPRPRVGRVRQPEGARTRESVVDQAVTLEPGDLIRPEDLALSRDHLSETRVFRSVDIRPETTDDAGVRDLVVDLAERPDLHVEYKVRYETGSSRESSDETSTEEGRGFQFGAGVEAVSPLGWAHRYSVYALAGKRRQLFGANFESQTFFARRWRTQVFLFDDNERDFETSGITRRIRNIAFQQTKRWRSGLSGRRWHDRLRLQWGYAYRQIFYTDPADGSDLSGFRAGVSSSLIGDTRDSVTDPHTGLFWTATVEPNLEALGSDKSFVRLYGQVFAYIPVGSKVVWAQALRAGAVPGSDPLLLLDRRFKAGGATTLRGFAENGLGPQYRDVSVGGQALFVFNQELRFPLGLWDRLYGGVFFDTGNVWALSSGLDLGDLRSNVGAGIRVMFPFGPVRLDWAWVLDPKDGEQRSRWQFALGHAF